MRYIHAHGPEAGIIALKEDIADSLKNNVKTLWLICGGSNIGPAVEVMKNLRQDLPPASLNNLTIMQTDERYGPVGHKDSNWQQMIEQGFDFTGVKSFPILRDLSLDKTVLQYGQEVEREFKTAQHIVALFGIGADGHIAGILPHSKAVSDPNPVSGYESETYTRISLTFGWLRKISSAYVMVFGEAKKEAIDNLKNKDLSLEEEPCSILKEISEVELYSDLV